MPTLPVELWLDILHHVVYIPGQFDTKWDYSPDSNLIWDGWKSLDSSYSESLKTKLSICRVSRTWWAMGVKLLYEHLIFTDDGITRPNAISKLVTTFEEHAADQGGYGRSTKRLEVHGNALPVEAPYYPSLLRLLSLCYNIRIFNIFIERPLHYIHQIELSSLLKSRFTHSLRRMSLQFDMHPHGPVRLPDIPLDSVQLSTAFFRDPYPYSLYATVSILCIGLFRYHSIAPYETHWLSLKFPALRHLTLYRVTANLVDRRFLQSFLSNLGPQLHSLHLTVGVPDDRYEPLYLLPDLLARATTLRSLALLPFKFDWGMAKVAGHAFPSITHIGVQSSFHQDPSYIEEFVSGSIFPGLKCIRFLDISNDLAICEDPRCERDWVSLLEVCHKRDIRIEDKDYRLLRISLPPNIHSYTHEFNL